ncbi:MAG: ribonuclease HII [Candidatus Kaiserbacteria bacterium]|nr:ribonuclease HII [Candidatus Kaiserbacteria bacterium]MCB9816237.1 ribonuclease HII [Candidatus Nomurabacteria bacterium]
MKAKWLVGVDEAGRGPLAGPVSVGVVVVPASFDWGLIEGVGDSKQIKPEKREALFRRAQDLRHHRKLDFAVAMVGSSVIDEKGISYAIKLAMNRCIKRLELDPATCRIRLDGSLHAPTEYSQETIIKGDATEPAIGLASIVAKVTRDKYMTKMARRYTQYGFEQHMGYGTKAHRQAIAERGKCPIHRASYCKNIKTL